MKTAWRHFLRSKVHSTINLLGLTLGLTAVLHIYLYVADELSYDKWLPGHERVVRLQSIATDGDGTKGWATTEGFVIPALASSYPEIEAAASFLRPDNDWVITRGDEQFTQNGIIAADSTFFDVFSLTYIYGSKEAARHGQGIVITREMAVKYFGDIDPVGQVLQMERGDITVAAVIEDVPAASHFHFKAILPMHQYWPRAHESRNIYGFYSYLKIREGVDPKDFEERVIKDWYSKYGYPDVKPESERGLKVALHTVPVADIHLQSKSERELEANGSLQVVYVFIGAGILLLVIAMINYINLSNAIAVRRSKEVAVRKAIGASKRRLFLNFMGESFVFTGVAILLSVMATALLIPAFNRFTGKVLDMQLLIDPAFLGSLLLVWIAVGLLSGVYPAAILSSYDPVKAMKSGSSGVHTSTSSGLLRKGLIVVQFTISALMIVVSTVIGRQMQFIQSKDIGFEKSAVVTLQLGGDARRKVEQLKTAIGRAQGVTSASATSIIPGKRVFILYVRVPDIAGTNDLPGEPDDGTRSMRVMAIDQDFVKTLGLQMTDGRDYSPEVPSDTAGFILNEAAVKYLGLTDPVGRAFEYVYSAEKRGKIIGVVKDFNFASVHSKVEPVVLHIFPPMYTYLCVKIDGSNTSASLDAIEDAWKEVTNAPFTWSFLDATYDSLYRTEQTTRQVISTFMTIAMLIAGLGLFGVVTLFAHQRMKEVGIRKVLGESTASLMGRLSREYLILVVIGNLVAAYPAYILTMKWLEQFAFRIDLPFSAFVLSLAVSEFLAIVSISSIVLKTASMNPISVLRHE